MGSVYDERLLRSLSKELIKCISAAAAVLFFGTAADVFILFSGHISMAKALSGSFFTFVSLTLAAWVWQKRLLPLLRVKKLLAALDQDNILRVEGTFRGYSETLGVHGGIFTRRIYVDAGDRFRNESYSRELELPAICANVPFKDGDRVELETVENLVVASHPAFSGGPVCAKKGAHALPSYVIAAILLLSVLLWLVIHTVANGSAVADVPRLAVCAPAHNEEMDTLISDTAGVEIGYSNTLNAQDVAQYLATYGTFDADVIVLGKTYFDGVYYGDASPLDPNAITDALGFAPKYIEGEHGEKLAVILYDPEDDAYNASFPRLYDWFAVEAGTPMLMMVRANSRFAGNGDAAKAVTAILKIICEK